MENLENRLFRNNLRMVGLPESILMKALQNICETDLQQALGFSHHCRVERAHRIGKVDTNRSHSMDDDYPPLSMRFLDYKTKNLT